MELSNINFNIIRDFIYIVSSISLADSKKYLVEQRLSPLIKDLNLASFDQLVELLSTTPDQNLIDMVISAMTTNESFFFRDAHIYDSIKKHIIPELMEKIGKKLKITIWSAACSMGQEPYTIAMLLDEFISNSGKSNISLKNFEIIATDIDPVILKKAKSGEYTNLEVSRGLPDRYRDKYFNKIDNNWTIDDKLKKIIRFKRMNLVGNNFYPLNTDFILCRNVLIYFDDDAKSEIINKMYRSNTDGGYLLLGSSESLYGKGKEYSPLQRDRAVFYKK